MSKGSPNAQNLKTTFTLLWLSFLEAWKARSWPGEASQDEEAANAKAQGQGSEQPAREPGRGPGHSEAVEIILSMWVPNPPPSSVC